MGRFYSQISKKIYRLGSHTICTNEVRFGIENSTAMPNFTLEDATCRPCGAKNRKSTSETPFTR